MENVVYPDIYAYCSFWKMVTQKTQNILFLFSDFN